MKLLDRLSAGLGGLLGRKATELTYDQLASLIDGGSGAARVAGVTVTEKTALQVSTVLACVKAIADGCATPRLHVYREVVDANGRATRQKATNIPEYRLLARRPNEWQTSFEFRRMLTAHAALCGTGLAIKSMGGNNRVTELLPVMPGQWDMEHTSRYDLRYRVWDEFGVIGVFRPDQVFTLHNLQWQWHKSLSYVMLARHAIGLAMAAETSQAGMHANGLRTSGTYSVEGVLSPEQMTRLNEVLKKRSGPANAGLPLVLDRSAKWLPNVMSGSDAQHVETRRLQVEEVCRAFGVFPIMVGHSDKAATFASSEAFFAAHLVHTLAPWHSAWTQRIDEMLLDGSGPLYAEFDTRYMTAGSLKDRAQWNRSMVEAGIYTRNEIRDSEGLDPLDGLDEPLTPMNMNGANNGTQDPPADPA